MKKYYLKNGKEVKFGDLVVFSHENKTKFGYVKETHGITLSNDSLPYLLKHEAIVVKDIKEPKKEPVKDLAYYVKKIQNQLELDEDTTEAFLDSIIEINPIACIQIFLKKIAVDFDKKYKDHISDTKYVWYISLADAKVYNIPTDKVKSFKTFSAFRTKEEAMKAFEIVKPIWDEMFLDD